MFLCGILQMSRLGLEWQGASDDFSFTRVVENALQRAEECVPMRPMIYAYLYIVPVLQHLEIHKFLCYNSNTIDGILQFDEFADPHL